LEISNKKAYHDYFIESSVVAGMVLHGTEIKSLREGQAGFVDSYCTFHQGELFIRNLHIAEYSMGTINNHDPVRERKLLLQKQELRRMEAKIKEKGYSIIPLRIFFTEKGIAKIEIGLARGKKQYDKRETLKQKDTDRMLKRQLGKN
jgi:SsrA-binding protein